MELQTIDTEIRWILIFWKRNGTSDKFLCLIAFTSQDIWYMFILIIATQFVTSYILKFTLVFWSSRFPAWQKIQNKNLNISRTKSKAFFIIFNPNKVGPFEGNFSSEGVNLTPIHISRRTSLMSIKVHITVKQPMLSKFTVLYADITSFFPTRKCQNIWKIDEKR